MTSKSPAAGSGPDDRIQLINGIFCLFSDNVTCIGAWGFYLFDAAFDSEPELRNRLGILCLASLLDSVEGADRTLARYAEKAEALGLSHLGVVCAQAETFVQLIEGVASLYTREEQAFISSVRDQYVHSWLAKRHRDRIPFKYFDGHKLTVEELPATEYHAMVRPFYQDPEGLDASLRKLVERFLRQPTDYWSAFSAVKAALPQLQAAMLDGREFVIPGFVQQD